MHFRVTHMSRFGRIAVAATLAALGGCATLTEDSTEQLLEVHAVQDNREVAGVGCVLSNKVGRWFVVAPGRVRVARYSQPLMVDCAREGIGRTVEMVDARYDARELIATAVTTGGLGYLVDMRSGAGFGYPETLTVVIAKPAPRADGAGAAENRVF
jgi:hypothetical protein